MRRSEDNVERLERLVDKKDLSSAEEAELRDLVQASRTVALSDEFKQGILASVLRRQQIPRRRGFPVFRPAVVFGLLVAGGATAAAALGHLWTGQQDRAVVPRAAGPALPQSHFAVPRAEAPLLELPVELPKSEAPSPRQASARIRTRSEDPSRVVYALEALRKQHDPDRAARLLAEYLAANPRGALVEEALALSIEAAAARRDATASEFAKRYLKDYPNGRFRQTAEAALAGR